jgi:hypothetical protein
MKVTANLNISGLGAEHRYALLVADFVFRQVGEEARLLNISPDQEHVEQIIFSDTPLKIRRPGSGSAHVVQQIQNFLGPEYEILLERDHIVITYDPDNIGARS